MEALHSSSDKAPRYTGPEKRGYPRIPANYPIFVRFASSSGEMTERYAQTKNVSAEGALFSCMETIDTGTKMEFHMGIPSAYAASLPAAQLNGEAVVVRSEQVNPLDEKGYGAKIALKFTSKPTLSTEISMFD